MALFRKELGDLDVDKTYALRITTPLRGLINPQVLTNLNLSGSIRLRTS